MPGLRERAQDVVGVVDGSRHETFGLATGIAEHDALIAGAFVLVALGVHALGDVGRLRVNEGLYFHFLPVKAFLFVADVLDGAAYHLLQQFVGDRSGTTRLAGEKDAVRRRHGLDGDARIGIRREIGIDDGVGDAIANLVGMAFGNGFAREE